MQIFAEQQSGKRADDRERVVFAENVIIHFAIRKAQHLERGKLAPSLRDIDVRQVQHDDEREGGGGQNQDADHIVQHAQAVPHRRIQIR